MDDNHPMLQEKGRGRGQANFKVDVAVKLASATHTLQRMLPQAPFKMGPRTVGKFVLIWSNVVVDRSVRRRLPSSQTMSLLMQFFFVVKSRNYKNAYYTAEGAIGLADGSTDGLTNESDWSVKHNRVTLNWGAQHLFRTNCLRSAVAYSVRRVNTLKKALPVIGFLDIIVGLQDQFESIALPVGML